MVRQGPSCFVVILTLLPLHDTLNGFVLSIVEQVAMNRVLRWVQGVGLCVLMMSGNITAQDVGGRWAIGALGGGTIWISDLNQVKFGGGGMLSIRYGVSQIFSVGFLGGFEVLKAGQDPPLPGLAFTYLHVDAYPMALSGYLRFAPNSLVSPYFRFGAGMMFYTRKTANGAPAPDDANHTTYIMPVGLGIEAFTSSHFVVDVDLGATNFSDAVDLRENTSPDGFLSARIGLHWFPGSSDSDDDDHDGLTNGEERRLGTDPHNPDTDGDGLSDGDEVRKYNTNPLRGDTDDDGLSDGEEVLKYHTDPTMYDTDGDGLSDGDEVLKYHTDPLRADTDGDGLSDGDEILRYHTDPLKVDTDGDGLSDGDEVLKYHTDPLKADTDGDGLSDGDEVLKYHTDPLKADTDGGSVNDGAEVLRGTNPLDPSDDVITGAIILERGKSLVLHGVTFVSGSAKLTRSSEEILERIFVALLIHADLKVEIAGYTDNVGTQLKNEQLSQRRADAVRTWLVAKGISAARLTAKGYGMRDPVDTNLTLEGRSRNRRIEFHVK
jgi:outer membrane protein OmpA-like peptidoglycan-associated protein